MTKIVQKDDPVLRKVAKRVKVSDIGGAKIRKVLEMMEATLRGESDGVAIAAPQIGVSLRIFIVSGKIFAPRDASEKDLPKSKIFINPTVRKASKKKEEMEEGCLSVRWKYGKVMRSTKTTVSARDEEGNKFTHTGSGVLAQIFQHEIEHLNGILFIDSARDVREVNPQKDESR